MKRIRINTGQLLVAMAVWLVVGLAVFPVCVGKITKDPMRGPVLPPTVGYAAFHAKAVADFNDLRRNQQH
jgi:hypothetical protein